MQMGAQYSQAVEASRALLAARWSQASLGSVVVAKKARRQAGEKPAVGTLMAGERSPGGAGPCAADAHTEQADDDTAALMKDSAREELEALATELQEVGDQNEYFNEEEVEQLEQATATLALTSEALETVRAARETLKGQKGKRGGGRFGRAPSGKGSRKGSKTRPAPDATSIKDRKAKSRCRVCGQQGHWSGDPECPQAQRTVHLAEGDPPEHCTEIFLCHTISVPTCAGVPHGSRRPRPPLRQLPRHC